MGEDEKPIFVEGTYNIPLEKPKGFGSNYNLTLFESVESFASGTGSSNFIPTWDSTDHFHFCCQNCECIANVLKVDYTQPPKNLEGIYTIYIFLQCPKCGTTGQRKIHLNAASFRGQQTVTETNKRLIFGRNQETIDTKQLKE